MSTSSRPRCAPSASRCAACRSRSMSVGQMLDGLFAITRDFDMQTQPHLLLLQKTMVMVEGVATALDPDINMWDVSAPFVQRMDPRRAWPRGGARRRHPRAGQDAGADPRHHPPPRRATAEKGRRTARAAAARYRADVGQGRDAALVALCADRANRCGGGRRGSLSGPADCDGMRRWLRTRATINPWTCCGRSSGPCPKQARMSPRHERIGHREPVVTEHLP